MWLLRTDNAELHWFYNPAKVPGGYAILSHVWDEEGEQTFQELRQLQKLRELQESATSRTTSAPDIPCLPAPVTTPRLHASETNPCLRATRNIRKYCALATSYVYAKLFHVLHTILLVLVHIWHKEDKSDQKLPEVQESVTRETSPRSVASEKIRKACELAESHGYRWLWVDACCIDRTNTIAHSEAINSVFQYYSFAQMCYVYLSDVPSDDDVRKEGSAFRRSRWHERCWSLQELLAPLNVVFLSRDWITLGTKVDLADLLEEITGIPRSFLRKERDIATVNVAERMYWASGRWAPREEDEAYCLLGIFGVGMPIQYGEGRQAFRRLQEEILKQSTDTTLFASGSDLLLNWIWPAPHDHDNDYKYLFAPSTDRYERHHGQLECSLPKWLTGEDLHPPPHVNRVYGPGLVDPATPTFTMTANGVRAWVPTFLTHLGTYVVLWHQPKDRRLHGLLLTPCPDVVDVSLPTFHVASEIFNGRVVDFGENSASSGIQWSRTQVAIEWKELYILPHPPLQRQQPITPWSRLCLTSRSTPFRLSESSLDSLMVWYTIECTDVDLPWDGASPAALFFRTQSRVYFTSFWLRLGMCGTFHWASVSYGGHTERTSPSPTDHACPGDHIKDWPELKKMFLNPNSYQDIELSFTACPLNLNPSGTYVVHIDSKLNW